MKFLARFFGKRKEVKEESHKHRPRAIRCQNVKQSPGGFLGNEGKQLDTTIVLFVCECGMVSTLTLLGTWTMDDLRGISAEDTAKGLMSTMTAKEKAEWPE